MTTETKDFKPHPRERLTTTYPIVVRQGSNLMINGSRISLYDVMDYVTANRTPEEIMEWLPMTTEQVAGALAYIEQHRAEVEVEYQEVLQYAEENRRYWEERNRERLAEIAARPASPETEPIRRKIAEWRRQRGAQ